MRIELILNAILHCILTFESFFHPNIHLVRTSSINSPHPSLYKLQNPNSPKHNPSPSHLTSHRTLHRHPIPAPSPRPSFPEESPSLLSPRCLQNTPLQHGTPNSPPMPRSRVALSHFSSNFPLAIEEGVSGKQEDECEGASDS